MKVLLVNHRYFVSGGPERYMFGIADMLEGAGHGVVPFSIRYRENLPSAWSQYFADPIAGEDAVYFRQHGRSPAVLLRGARRAFYDPKVGIATRRLVSVARPDVALVQNYLRKLSPSVLVALKQADVPMVVRLSDFSMLCPEGHLLREGQSCRLCVTGSLLTSVRHRCVQGSWTVSAAACAGLWFARWRKYFDLIDWFIAPSATLRDEMVQAGYDGRRIEVIPTFVDAGAFQVRRVRERRIAYVGRLSPEKGVETLLDAFARLTASKDSSDLELMIAGGGEEEYSRRLRAKARDMRCRVTFMGMLDHERVRSVLGGALLSVVPSLCYENLPNSLLESLASGTPIVASNLGSMAEVLRDTDAGALFSPGDPVSLAQAMSSMLSDRPALERMRVAARRLAETSFSPATHLAALEELLERASRGGA